MPSSFRRSLPITGAAVVMTGALALAQTHATPAPRVRPETRETRALLDELLERSPTARELLASLAGSDVIAYVRHRTFTASTLHGRLGFVRSEAPTRTLIVEIGCQQPWLEQLVVLGHELQHVAEIAAAPAVVDPPSMVRYFERIGMRLSGPFDLATFETERAQRTSTRVRNELIGGQRITRGPAVPGQERHSHERP